MLNFVRRAIAFRAADLVETATVTSKGQITIPSRLRKELRIIEGENVLIVREGDLLKIIPLPKLSKLAGVDTEMFRGRKPSAELETTRKEWTKEFEERVRRA
jgi:AbrB family looped-hinge helix DNA binding protein